MSEDVPRSGVIGEMEPQAAPPENPGEAGNHKTASPLSRRFRISSTLAGLAAGLVLIAYGEGFFEATTVAPAALFDASPAKLKNEASPKLSEAAAEASPQQLPAQVTAAKKRPAGSKRPAGAVAPAARVRPVADVKPPRRRNLLGLRSVADWMAGRFSRSGGTGGAASGKSK